MVDLGGYVIILVETREKKVRLYGSPADKADLEVADEILEINGESLENSTHTDVISHIHNCIKSRTICLRVKRRTGNKLARELAENSHVQDAFVIAVEQQAKERLERLSALRKIKPVDMTKLSQQLCESPPSDPDKSSSAQTNNTIYSTPLSQLGSTSNLHKQQQQQPQQQQQQRQASTNKNKNNASAVPADNDGTKTSTDSNGGVNKNRHSNKENGKSAGNNVAVVADGGGSRKKTSLASRKSAEEGGGYITDEELELCQTIESEVNPTTAAAAATAATIPTAATTVGIPPSSPTTVAPTSTPTPTAVSVPPKRTSVTADDLQSPSKEVLIADNGSRRSSRSSLHSSLGGVINSFNNNNGSIKNGHLRMVEEEAKLQQGNNSKNSKEHKPLTQTLSLKFVVDKDQMTSMLGRLSQASANSSHSLKKTANLDSLSRLLQQGDFQQLLKIHNKVQAVQCFQCPPMALCSDTRALVQECMSSLRASELAEAAEILQILQRIELEGLFFAHDKLAERQSALPWAKCLAEMWTKERNNSSSSSSCSNMCASASASAAGNTSTSTNTVPNTNNTTTTATTAMATTTTSTSSTTTTAAVTSASTPLDTSLSVLPTPEVFAPPPIINNNNNNSSSNSSNSGNSDKPSSQRDGPLPGDHAPAATCPHGSSASATASASAVAESLTRVVKIVKENEPLGATVRNEGDRVVIGRVVKGGAAERSGQLGPGDEVLEVNGLKLKGRSVHDICDSLCQMTGTLTFVIIPVDPNRQGQGQDQDQGQGHEAAEALTAHAGGVGVGVGVGVDVDPHSGANDEVFHFRAHFVYNPDDDLYIPCHELGISFQRGDILHVINREDPHWWQAYRDGEWTQTLAGLIPSLSLQKHRMALQKQKREQDLKEQREIERQSPARKKGVLGGGSGGSGGGGSGSTSSLLCARKSNKRKKMGSPFKKADKFEVPPYEEMCLYYPQANQRRPLILVGPPSIGRHELRLRLLEDVIRFAAAVPHTTRSKGDGEIDGQDYNFVSRSQFEEYVNNKRFVEHGEFDKQYYGTSLDSVRTVINSGKICVLNLQPGSLQILHDSDLKPYVVFLTPPTLHVYRQHKINNGEQVKEDEYRDSLSIAQDMETHYGHYFDSVIPFESVDYVFDQLIYEINLLEREPQWVPAKWINNSNANGNGNGNGSKPSGLPGSGPSPENKNKNGSAGGQGSA